MNILILAIACAIAAPFLFASLVVFLRDPLRWDRAWQDTTRSGRRARTDIREDWTLPVERRMRTEVLDLPALLRDVADSLAALAWEQFTRINLAVGPGRTIRADPNVMRMVLRETIATALRATAGGQVLVSVLPLGMGLQIVITDDGPHGDPRKRESEVRGAIEMLALMGGTAFVESWPGRGTTMTLRLPLAAPGGGFGQAQASPPAEAPLSQTAHHPADTAAGPGAFGRRETVAAEATPASASRAA